MGNSSQVFRTGSTKSPKRMCLICRRRDEKVNLIRFAMIGPSLTWDRDHKIEGRGVYVHPNLQCLGSGSDPARWARALKSSMLSKEEVSIALRDVLSVVMMKVE